MKKLIVIIIILLIKINIFAVQTKVLIYKGNNKVNLQNKTYKYNGHYLKINYIRLIDGKIYLDNHPVDLNEITIAPKNKYVCLDGKKYNGKLIVFTDYINLYLINLIEIEEYLKGVLPKEVNSKWPVEVLKAQAIASRTYIYKRKKMNNKLYDVGSSHFYQVYGGVNSKRKKTNYAVDRTKNIVMTFKGDLIYSFYYSSSGGYTASSYEVWKSNKKFGYLKAKKDPYSVNTPYDYWSYKISSYKFKKIFNLENIKDIKLYYSKSKRVRYLDIIQQNGNKKRINGNDLRLKIGSRKLKSTMFDMNYDGQYFKFSGKGWGHGVGMSQWGAYRMAKNGYNYKEILKFYYSGISFSKVL